MATSATYGTALYGSSQYGIVFVTSNAGAYTITGGAASFRYDYATQAASGSYSITGGSASLLVSHILARMLAHMRLLVMRQRFSTMKLFMLDIGNSPLLAMTLH